MPIKFAEKKTKAKTKTEKDPTYAILSKSERVKGSNMAFSTF